MGLFYSLGVIFDEKTQAESFLNDLNRQIIVLSDSTVVPTISSISLTSFRNVYEQKYVVSLFPGGLEIGRLSNKKFISKPFFYEIRDFIYHFLFVTNHEFRYALYDLEGADKLITDHLMDEILNDGIGEIENGDKLASYCFSEKKPGYYYSKRLLDGLVISDSEYPNVQIDFPAFTEFKKGYSWLPLPNYKN